MAFFIDNRTEEDLNIYTGPKTILGLFSDTVTGNGGKVLEAMFRYPPSSAAELNGRRDTFRLIINNNIRFPFHASEISACESYLYSLDEGTLGTFSGRGRGLIGKLELGRDGSITTIKNGINAMVSLMEGASAFIDKTEKTCGGECCELTDIAVRTVGLLKSGPLAEALKIRASSAKEMEKLSGLDNIFRRSGKEETAGFMDFIYKLDAFCSVARKCEANNFSFASFSDEEEASLKIEGLHHPFLEKPVSNDILMDASRNVLFLTGSNMSGKSTLMKALGVSIFLAHIGFPVPASSMTLHKFDGIFTTINLTDDFKKGYSHFYSEVMRVKTVITAMKKQKLAVLFDEIFRGTNVKDAYDATVGVVDLFSTFSDSITLISSHIADAADTLAEGNARIRTCFLRTNVSSDSLPVPTYKLEDGICRDRFGLTILKSVHPFDAVEQIPEAEGFIADKQTLDDLNISARFTSDSIYTRYNGTRTVGGKRLFDRIYNNPLTSADAINSRTELIRCFAQAKTDFPFTGKQMQDVAEFFIGGKKTTAKLYGMSFQKKFLNDDRYDKYKASLYVVADFVKTFRKFAVGVLDVDFDPVLKKELENLNGIASQICTRAGELPSPDCNNNFSYVVALSKYVGNIFSDGILQMAEFVYKMDVVLALASIYNEFGLSFARAREGDGTFVEYTNVTYPFMKNAVANSLKIGGAQNLLMLTGPNMAGKSTTMRSIGSNLYLAHIGFPVFAEKMEFTVMDGMYSTINLSDNIDMHYSHYFAEVMRVKEVASQIAGGKKIFVLFDELFKGTNVKDAYDATYYVISEFLKNRKSVFLISTHISEVTKALRDENRDISFKYLDSNISGKEFSYTYKLHDGISDNRFGMYIIRREGIVE
ncbi:MAG: hypothetical protein LKI53_05895 [Bacteroidales bacterium]|jgi:DNA mismatch repair ATPase MutS|nr:hypothetical protein [Bacteroidales bacterium]